MRPFFTAFSRILLCSVAVAAITALLTPAVHAQPSTIKVLRVRLAPFFMPKHKPTQMLFIDWKNVGKKPIRQVRASLHFLDVRGKPVSTIPGLTPDAIDTTIFEDYAHPIGPGATYKEPNGMGYVLVLYPGAKKAVRAHVTITAAIAATTAN